MKVYAQVLPGRVMVDIENVIEWIHETEHRKDYDTVIGLKNDLISEFIRMKNEAIEAEELK